MKKRNNANTKHDWFLYFALIIVFGAAYIEKRFDSISDSLSVIIYSFVVLLLFCYIIFKYSEHLHRK